MPTVQISQLKKYLLSNFSKKSGCYTSLIDVFFNNKMYYNIMMKMNMIAPEADLFLHTAEKDLENAMRQSNQIIRDSKISEIIDKYVEKSLPSIKLESTKVTDKALTDPQYFCMDDGSTLTLMEKVCRNRYSDRVETSFLKLKCPQCQKRYAAIDGYPIEKQIKLNDRIYIRLDGEEYINLIPQKAADKEEHIIPQHSAEKNISDSLSKEEKTKIVSENQQLERRQSVFRCPVDFQILNIVGSIDVKSSRKKKMVFFQQLQCPQCHTLYTNIENKLDLKLLRIDGIQYFNLTNAMNQQRIRTTRYLKNKTACCVCDRNIPVRCIKCREVLRKTQVLLQKRRKNKKIQEIYTSPYCSRCGIYYISKLKYLGYQSLWEAVDERTLRKSVAEEEEQIIKTRQQQKLRAQMTLRKRTQDHLSEKQMTREGKISQPQKAVGMKIEGNRKSSAECIELEDFVVRRTTFKCLHQHHTLQNVDANIGLIDRLGNIIQAKASAGYCEECKVFFIMESTYQNLKLRGTPMCRISDEKAYMAREVVSNGHAALSRVHFDAVWLFCFADRRFK